MYNWLLSALMGLYGGPVGSWQQPNPYMQQLAAYLRQFYQPPAGMVPLGGPQQPSQYPYGQYPYGVQPMPWYGGGPTQQVNQPMTDRGYVPPKPPKLNPQQVNVGNPIPL